MNKRFSWAALVAIAIIAIDVAPSTADPMRLRRHPQGVPHHYIALFSDASAGGQRVAKTLARQYHARLLYVYTHALRGFAVEMSEQEAANLSRDARIASVEQDLYVRPTSVQTGTGVHWALDRIDQRTGTDNSYTYMKTGAGVRVYIVDSGVSTDDAVVMNGYTAQMIPGTSTPDYSDVYCSVPGAECHGSKVASIIGGWLYGVAKNAILFNVRVIRFGYSAGNPVSDLTTTADVVGGIDWSVGNHQAYPSQPAVMNVSLDWSLLPDFPTTSCSTCQRDLEQAVINAIDAGIVVVVGAGNYDTTGPTYYDSDACSSSPARLGALGYAGGLTNPHNRTTITVSATNSEDVRAKNELSYYDSQGVGHYWSAKIGSCVDIFAPGVGVGARTAVEYAPDIFGGTSAAAPFVTGVVALHLEGKGSSYDPNDVEAALKRNATSNVLTNIGSGSPNLLVYSRVDLWN